MSRTLRWIVPLAWMGVIFTVSAQPQLPNLTPNAPKLQETIGHLTVYLILALLWQWALRGAGVRRAGLWAVLISILYGLSDEYHQSFVPGRAVEFYDLMVDAIGAICGVYIGSKLIAR